MSQPEQDDSGPATQAAATQEEEEGSDTDHVPGQMEVDYDDMGPQTQALPSSQPTTQEEMEEQEEEEQVGATPAKRHRLVEATGSGTVLGILFIKRRVIAFADAVYCDVHPEMRTLQTTPGSASRIVAREVRQEVSGLTK